MITQDPQRQSSTVSPQRIIGLLFAGGALLVLTFRILPFTDDLFVQPYRFGEQADNLRLADEHAKKLHPVLNADPRFHAVQLQPYTGEGGCLAVTGHVASESDLRELKRVVIASCPPIKAIFTDVFVVPPNLE